MEKRITTKKITGFISLVFVVSILTTPIANAATESITDLYSNPNQSNVKDPYKFTAAQVLKSGVIQQVIGCTGVVNKVSGWMVKIIQSDTIQKEIEEIALEKYREQLESACSSIKAGATGSAGSTPQVNDLVTAVKIILSKGKGDVGGDTEKICLDQVKAVDKDTLAAIKKQVENERTNTLKEQCFDGIAIALAKNQLTSMTRSVMNWVNTGYGGNPFFVQNMTTMTNNIEKNIMAESVDQLTSDGAYPYGSDFSRSLIKSYNSGLSKYGSTNFWDSLSSDLSLFIDGGDEYSNTGTYGIGGTTDMTPLQISQQANNRFAEDFSSGGWEGWLALTQRDQNNPLGFTMLASQRVYDQINEQTSSTKKEVSENNGFLNQKECIKWVVYDTKTKKPLKNPKYTEWQRQSLGLIAGTTATTNSAPDQFVYSKTKRTNIDRCAVDGWKVVTPGSLIKEKVTYYLNSPERQLELADTINESLNALFSVLISKLEEGGLSGLSDASVSVDWTDTTNLLSSDGSNGYDNNGAYNNFNLTKDLGNIYIHDTTYSLGNWNAKTNKTDSTNSNYKGLTSRSLYQGLSPVTDDEANTQSIPTTNVYYTVTTAGKTKIIENGYNGWEVGDRAFWDGSGWQNWKAGQTSPIKKRGVVQIQKDYIVAAKDILSVLPNVMPKIGELDYCIPGPNPNYKTNSTDAQTAYQDWIGSLYVGPGNTGGNQRTYMSVARAGDKAWDDWASIYNDNPNVFTKIKDTFLVKFLLSWFNTYHYDKNGSYPRTEQNNIEGHKTIAELNIDYANRAQFDNFYEAFDKMMNLIYFNNMTKEYKEYENRPTDYGNNSKDKNRAYIPMAESGMAITSNIMYYNNQTTTAIEEYSDSIKKANENISKLEPIKAEVGSIIKAAQARRDAALLEKIKKDKCTSEYNKCINSVNINTGDDKTTFRFINRATATPKNECEVQYENCMSTPVSEADKQAYKTKYQDCFDEENIMYYDVNDIMNGSEEDGTRCYDNIDNDLDGLIDDKDPDCKSTNINTNNEKKHCVLGVETTNSMNMPNNKKCSDRKTESECLNTDYYHGTLANVCNWTTETGITPPTTSLYGCRIDDKIKPKPDNGLENRNCLLRTEGECTINKYIDNNAMGYTCKFVPF